ncbi:MAG TPA: hypothetical protein VL727_07355 [Puia sp.]|jgi:hypothetical protein|nr:hypothetical protein [Puia sp.]
MKKKKLKKLLEQIALVQDRLRPIGSFRNRATTQTNPAGRNRASAGPATADPSVTVIRNNATAVTATGIARNRSTATPIQDAPFEILPPVDK